MIFSFNFSIGLEIRIQTKTFMMKKNDLFGMEINIPEENERRAG